MTRQELNAANERVLNAAPLESPLDKWSLNWRSYMGSQQNSLLVGFWYAARRVLPPDAPRTGIVSLAGGEILPYTYGQVISGWDKVTTGIESTYAELVHEGISALDRLQEFLKNNEV